MKKRLLTSFVLFVFLLSSSITVFAENSFTPKTIEAGSKAAYDIDLNMQKDGSFKIVSKVKIKNDSDDEWREVPFYFIPQVFTKENTPEKKAGKVSDLAIKVNKKKVKNTVGYDRIHVNLGQPLKPGSSVEIEISYSLSLSKSAYRLLQSNKNYYMAQWYPMVPTYQNGYWNIQSYVEYGESYHTAHSSFKLDYNLQSGYQLASSSEQDSGKSKGTVRATNIKEMYIAVLNKDTMVKTKKLNDKVTLRVLGNKKYPKLIDTAIKQGTEAFNYYEKNVGPYPMKQLDIVLTDNSYTGHMEYSGIVTVIASPYGKDTPDEEIEWSIKHPLVHEIAHQWFYGTVNNDPYSNAWIDEGMTEFLTELYFYSLDPHPYRFMDSNYYEKDLGVKKPSNLYLYQYTRGEYNYFIYEVPKNKLWNLFSKYGGYEKVLAFLKDYYQTYSFKQLDTEEFVRFTMKYLNLENDLSFRSWLRLKGYYDVPKDHYAYEEISKIKEYGLDIGYEDGTFRPDEAVTRYDVATLFATHIGVDLTQQAVPFVDLEKDDPNYDRISAVVKTGYFKEEDHFYPKNAFTNQEFSHFLVNVINMGLIKVSKERLLQDQWLAKYVQLNESNQITEKEHAKIENITRAEYVYVLYQMMNERVYQ